MFKDGSFGARYSQIPQHDYRLPDAPPSQGDAREEARRGPERESAVVVYNGDISRYYDWHWPSVCP